MAIAYTPERERNSGSSTSVAKDFGAIAPVPADVAVTLKYISSFRYAPLIRNTVPSMAESSLIAARYPDIPGAIISCGANTSPKTMKPYFIIGVKFNNMFHHDKLNDMMLTLPDITAEMLGEITAPTYIVAGEHDIMWLSDTAYMYRKIPNSRIAIIKGAGHSTYMSHDGKQAYILAKGFFDTL